MEICPFCYKICSYDCASCKVSIWKKPTKNQESFTRDNILEELKRKLKSDQIENIMINLTKKIKLLNKCIQEVIQKTDMLIEYLQISCMETIKILKAKERYYKSLLNISNKAPNIEERKQLQKELRTSIIICIPTPEFRDIENFYKFDFVKVIDKANKFKYMKDYDFKKLLKKEYNSIDERYSGKVTYLESAGQILNPFTITSDNKCIVYCTKSQIIVWNIQDRKQERAFNKSVYFDISKIMVTNDGKYIVAAGSQILKIIQIYIKYIVS